MRNTNLCPLMYWLLGVNMECVYPDLPECGYAMLPYKGTLYQFGFCKHMAKEIGLTAVKQIALIKLKELMEVNANVNS